MSRTVNVEQLARVLEARITAQGGTWRQAAGEIGVSPALLSRLRNGQQPDLPSYAKITRWLNMSADEFLVDPAASATTRSQDGAPPPELASEVSALLRARRDLADDDKRYLEEIFSATLRHVRARQSADG
ncbi:helix-turn-helix transcriptional regulator [Cellulosimicrobium sp. ES-005]|uniref:Helix-turn-helix transcriptional regulator n=1 Tax=Cellulosimicrobium sp. ES-005 TaxID=3163031 RepID=A0AAU8G300_9MICO